MAAILPEGWRRCPAISWNSTADISRGDATSNGSIPSASNSNVNGVDVAIDTAGRGLKKSNDIVSTPSDLLIYALWKEILSKETIVSLEVLKDWPLLPVISKGRKLLLSPTLLPYVFEMTPTITQDTKRAHLQREAGRLSSLVLNEAAQQKMRGETDPSHDWDWTAVKADVIHFTTPLVRVPGREVRRENSDNEENNNDALYLNNSNDVLMGSGGYGLGALPPSPISSAEEAAEDVGGGLGLNAPSSELFAVMIKLGLPVLDCGLLEVPPTALLNAQAEVLRGFGGGALGRRLLESLYTMVHKNVMVYKPMESDETQAQGVSVKEEGFILSFQDISDSERILILQEILKNHNIKNLNPVEISQLQILPLFTARSGSNTTAVLTSGEYCAIAIADCLHGVYWCLNQAVLEGIYIPTDVPGMMIRTNMHTCINLHVLVKLHR